jgi:hypothetical protein
MKVGLQLCFSSQYQQELNSFLQYVKFTPKAILKGRKVRPWDEKKHRKLLQKLLSSDDVVFSRDGDAFSCITAGVRRTIEIIQEENVFFPTAIEVEKLIDDKNFFAGYLYNEEYEFVQSLRHSDKLSERTVTPEILATIKNTPMRDGVWCREYITTFNPGCSEMIRYTYLMVTWKMWFGELFFSLVPKDRILNFPHATEIKELPNGQVYVQLYDKIEEPYTPENVFRQWKWREWLEYDRLIENYPY